MEYRIFDGGREYRYASIIDARKKAIQIVRNQPSRIYASVRIWSGNSVYGWIEYSPIMAYKFVWMQNKKLTGTTQQGVRIDGTLW